MKKLERNVVNWVQKNLMVLFVLAVTMCSLIIRILFRNFVSMDSSAYLLPWWEEIRNNGGFHALGTQVGDYNMLYQFLVAVMTYLPGRPLYQYKILSGIFDYLLAAVIGCMTYDMNDRNQEKGLLAYVAVIMSPLVILNSSAWAQCDSIYVFFIVVSLFLLMKQKYRLAFVMLGMAFSFKLQTVFILPFFIYDYFKEKKFSVCNFVLVPLVMCLTALPNIIMGRSIWDVFLNYVHQTGSYEQMALNYPSFWCIFNEASGFDTLERPAIIITIVLIGTWMYLWLKSESSIKAMHMIYSAFILAYTCVFFLPRMHERYGFLYEILSILIAFGNKKTIPLCLTLNVVSMVTYAQFLYGIGYNARMLAVINGVIYVLYLMILLPSLLEKVDEIKY